MATVFYKDYRSEIQPFLIPGGGVRAGSCGVFGSVRPVWSPSFFPHLPFPSQEAVRVYAETVAHQWVDQRQEPRSEQTLKTRFVLTQEEQRERAAVYGDHLAMSKSEKKKTAIDARG